MPSDSASTFNFKVFSALILRRSWIIVLCFLRRRCARVYLHRGDDSALRIGRRAAGGKAAAIGLHAGGQGQGERRRSGERRRRTEDDRAGAAVGRVVRAGRHFGRAEGGQGFPARIAGQGTPTSRCPRTRSRCGWKKATTIKLRHNTRLIDVAVDHPDPATAQLIAHHTREHVHLRERAVADRHGQDGDEVPRGPGGEIQDRPAIGAGRAPGLRPGAAAEGPDHRPAEGGG